MNYNVKFQYGICGNGATAYTDPKLNNGWSTITIDPNVNSQATDLSIARTIMHEVLHAYLLFEEKYPSNCDLNCLLNKSFDKYGKSDYNPSHHAVFVETKYLDDIASELENYAQFKGYNTNTLSNQYFKDMAWGGLTGTDVFKNSKNDVEKNRIIDRIRSEIKGIPEKRPAVKPNGELINIVTIPNGIKACN